ncbi:MAG: energy transducer TonB, partial [Candidatus Aminicenantes bacterium]|nr:energy transducer TonB [Candidatus Aminicenantes bacterium]
MNKRVIGLFAVLLLVLFVASCGGKREKSTTSNGSVNQAQKQEKKIKPSTSGKILEEPSEFPEEDIEENDKESTGQEGVPNLLEGELPSYPDALKGKNITGRVVMRIRVAPNGKVTEVQLKETTLEKFTDAT